MISSRLVGEGLSLPGDIWYYCTMSDNQNFNNTLSDTTTPAITPTSMRVRMKFGIIGMCVCLLLVLATIAVLTSDLKGALPTWFDGEEIFESFFFPLYMVLLVLAMGGVSGYSYVVTSIVVIVVGGALSLVMYFIIGYIIGLIYEKIRDRISGKVAILVTLAIVLVIPINLVYGRYRNHKKYFHIGATPSDCAKLKPEDQNWCYRNIYRLNSVPEVCIHLDGSDEEEECGRRYGAQSGSLASCAIFSKKELLNHCKWGVAFAHRDISLCNELPDDDSTFESTQKSCIDVITNYWENNKDFYFDPEKDEANKKAKYNNQ